MCYLCNYQYQILFDWFAKLLHSLPSNCFSFTVKKLSHNAVDAVFSFKGEGMLTICRKFRLVRPLHNGKQFSEKCHRSGWEGPYHLTNRRSDPLGQYKRDWRKRKFLQMVRKFQMEIPIGNCGVGTPQFPNGISRKLLCHLISNRNFQLFGQMVSTQGVVKTVTTTYWR